MDLSTPKNVVDVKYFMGLAGYYRRYTEGFSNISHPITSLQRKNEKFVWFKECEESFYQLKNLLTKDPILNIENPKKDFVVCTYACIEGLGGVLMQ